MIKVVSFDIGGTLIKNSENSNSKNYDLKNLAELIGSPYEQVREVYKTVFQKTNGTFEFLVETFCNMLIYQIF
ncbi:MAG: hypothetical protein Q4G04_02735 [bacterium]|nr:hypothetical protein [bacterium]